MYIYNNRGPGTFQLLNRMCDRSPNVNGSIFPHCFQDWRVSAVGNGHMFKRRVLRCQGNRDQPLFYSLSVFYQLSVICLMCQCLWQMYRTAYFRLQSRGSCIHDGNWMHLSTLGREDPIMGPLTVGQNFLVINHTADACFTLGTAMCQEVSKGWIKISHINFQGTSWIYVPIKLHCQYKSDL